MTKNISLVIGCGVTFFLGFMPESYAAMTAECADHLIAPAPGHELSPAAMDSNNACVFFMQQASQVAELRAKIAESEKREKGNNNGSRSDRNALTEQYHPQPQPVAPAPAPAPVILPVIEQISENEKHQTEAVLSFPDGGFMTVGVRSHLPDGSVVTQIRGPSTGHSGVDIEKNGTITPLLTDSGTKSSTDLNWQPSQSQRLFAPNQSAPLIPTLPAPPAMGGG